MSIARPFAAVGTAARLDPWTATVVAHWPHGASCDARLRVAIALGDRACTLGDDTFTTSLRWLAERAGVGGAASPDARSADTKTVAAALRGLQADGLITLSRDRFDDIDKRTALTRASTRVTLAPVDRLPSILGVVNHPFTSSFEPNRAARTTTADAVPVLAVSSEGLADQLLHGLFERAHLGMTCGRAWLLIAHSPATVSHVAAVLGVSRVTARSALRTLAAVGMAERRNGRWHHVARNLDEVAAELGFPDRRANRQATHRRERESRARHLRAGALAWQQSATVLPNGEVVHPASVLAAAVMLGAVPPARQAARNAARAMRAVAA